MNITEKPFGEKEGDAIHLYTLRNAAGDEASISMLGATLTRWTAADCDGRHASVVLGFERAEPYLTDKLPYFGPIVGRYANRIAHGSFVLDGVAYQLPKNQEPNHLHGGFQGFDKKVWEALVEEDGLVLRYTSADGEEGYPGTLQATVRYTLSDDNTLTISCEATTDKPTIVNLTMHGWFNLSGVPGSTMLDHELQIAASRYTEVFPDLIPTGFLAPVEKTAFDFRQPRLLGEAISQMPGGGFDHNFVLDDGSDVAVTIYHPQSGRQLSIRTDQPGMQLYTAQLLDGSILTDNGIPIPMHGAIVLEPQHFPDSPNHPVFPSTVLRPGEVYRATSSYSCKVRR